MSQIPVPPEPEEELQFTTAEPSNLSPSVAASAGNCLICKQPISSIYFALRDKVLCPACCARVKAPPPGTKAGRVAKATIMGLGAGLVGAVIWYLLRTLAHVEIGLVAVLVGFMVGKAVRKGSGGYGGRGYQVLAVVLTYCCIAANYMPDVVRAAINVAQKDQSAHVSSAANDGPGQAVSTPADRAADTDSASDSAPRATAGPVKRIGLLALFFVIIFAVALAAPFLAGIQNAIGLLIIGFALWEAWKFNARRIPPITGPYQIGAGSVIPDGGAAA